MAVARSTILIHPVTVLLAGHLTANLNIRGRRRELDRHRETRIESRVNRRSKALGRVHCRVINEGHSVGSDPAGVDVLVSIADHNVTNCHTARASLIVDRLIGVGRHRRQVLLKDHRVVIRSTRSTRGTFITHTVGCSLSKGYHHAAVTAHAGHRNVVGRRSAGHGRHQITRHRAAAQIHIRVLKALNRFTEARCIVDHFNTGRILLTRSLINRHNRVGGDVDHRTVRRRKLSAHSRVASVTGGNRKSLLTRN